MTDALIKAAAAAAGLLFSLTLSAEPLQQKISGIDEFKAEFVQQVQGPDGALLSEADGTLALRRPETFMLHTAGDDELYLYSRADGVYYYDPFVNQLTIMPLSTLWRTPFALLITDDQAVWQRYRVTEQKSGAVYVIEPAASAGSDFVKIELNFAGQFLSSLKVWFQDGNVNVYDFRAQRLQTADRDFALELPPDTEIADER